MLSNLYFYHQLTRKYVILFGNMFNNITIKRINKDTGYEIERMKVPIVYAPKEKYYARLRADPDLNRPIQVVLPRMSFELTNFSYDPSRKQNSMVRMPKANTNSSVISTYMGVPYDLSFDLQIYARNVDDGTHIVEQILPYFNPDYTVTINSIPQLGFLKDIPIILNSVSNMIEHEGNFDAVRYVSWTLNFTMKAYFYGPISSSKIIRTVYANIFNDPTLQAGYIVRTNTTDDVGNFKPDDIVYQGANYNDALAYGIVIKYDSDTHKLIIGGAQGQFKVGQTVKSLSTNSTCTISGFELTPMKLSEVKIQPNPLDANPDDDFGYTTTITEFYNGNEPPPPSNYQPSADSDLFTVDNDDLTVDTE